MKFTDLLRDHGVRFLSEGHEHCRPGWVQVDCPFCSKGGGRFRMGYNLSYGYVNCWACGAHALGDTLAELLGLPVGRCLTLLGGLSRERVPNKERPKGTLKIPPGVGGLLGPHKKFLRKRGFDPQEVERLWGVRGIGLSSKLAWRLFIPISLRGEVVSWSTRSVTDDHATRYRSAGLDEESLPHKDLLYGEDYARHAIVVNEGFLDVWTLGPGAVATCGAGYSRAQLLRMTKYPTRVIAFDNEPKAQERARKLCRELEVFPGKTFNVVFSGKDASRSPAEEVKEVRRLFLD